MLIMSPEEIAKRKIRFTEHQVIAVRENSVTPEAMNQNGSIDYFMHYAPVCGRRLRTFNVVDDFNREALAIEIDLNIPTERVSLTLAQ